MGKNNVFSLRRLFFTVILFVFSVTGVIAQSSSPAAGTGTSAQKNDAAAESKTELDSVHDIYDKILSVKTEIEKERLSLEETAANIQKLLLKKTKMLEIMEIVSSVSQTLIAVILFVYLALLLLKKGRFQIVCDSLKDTGCSDTENTSSDIKSEDTGLFKNQLDDIQSQLKQLANRMDLQLKDASRFESSLTSLQSDIADNRQKIKDMNAAVSSIRIDMDRDKEKHTRKEEVETDPVRAFNNWAQNSRQPLPQYYTYVAILKLEFRTKQDFTDTQTETDWIRNTIGEKKYLFPNPNKIDSLSGPVDKLYKVVGLRKGTGANTVKITNACQIKEGNFIEYQGELILI